MSDVTKKQLRTQTAAAGVIALLALFLWLVSALTKAHWVPEYAECARLGALAVMASAAVWVAVGWLSRLLD